ncbi:methyltransferase domain-containing protein [Actinoplanes sp. LDG1-06]|uniref:Methyltransferase domain-containing protein n=1 Tax=Paractinoplanes ovalisporus TaxID=2810368 RepID=A0ABS2AR98_9ACTN|nr:methyltransferase domain-containing protein [Actinoplanes ovalisporus]MBM2622344.1 methyltransferase domain-containing protein [Actinoplanes ovalisporus]
MWDPAVYRRFGAERQRPFFDLVNRVGAEKPRAVTDLGCGPGELTLTLAERWPGAHLTGVDSSPEMIEKAVAHGGPAEFRVGDVREWQPGPDTDVLVTNATLQWVPEHRDLLTRWARDLPAGAWIAMQVPGNFGAPSHVLLREVGKRYGASDVLREAPVDDPAGYAALLTAAGAEVDAWETTYLHLLPAAGADHAAESADHAAESADHAAESADHPVESADHAVAGADHPVLRWMEGTALRPVKAALDENAWQSFRADLARELSGAYPATGAYVAFPFRRIFVVARTAR